MTGQTLRESLQTALRVRGPLNRRTSFIAGATLTLIKYVVDAAVIYFLTGIVWRPTYYVGPLVTLGGGVVTALPTGLRVALMRARGAAYEVSTIGSLKALHSAQIAYSTSCAGGYDAPTIPNLATPPTGGGQAFIGPEFKANSTTRQNYTILFTAGTVAAKAPKTCNALAAGQALSTFFVGADLISATNGKVSRYFGVNQHGLIYWSTKRISPFYSGLPPAPATPIS